MPLDGLGSRPIVMGILNVTPDSFSDGGKYVGVSAALERAREMVNEGADIIDVGGESTRPGAEPVPLEEELERVIPVIEAIKAELDVPISVDTYKAPVAEEALKAGAVMVNDVSGMRFSPDMARVVARYGAYGVVMHMKGTPRDMQKAPFYHDVVGEVKAFFQERLDHLVNQGVDRKKVILDPGIGFGKRLEDNLALVRGIPSLLELGCPLLLGPSRKSFIGRVLNLPVEERLEGTLAVVAIAVFLGATLVRVHDVLAARRAVDMAWALRDSPSLPSLGRENPMDSVDLTDRAGWR